jgi:site-specific recombinase XerD
MPETKLTSHLTAQTPLASAINSWQAYLVDKGRSPNTIKAFLSDVRLLTTFLPEDVAVGRIGTADLNRYFEWMEKERDVPCSPKTLARRITATKSLFRWLHQYGVLAVDPAEKVAQRSAISPLPTVLTPEEYDAVLLAADRHRRGHKPDARPYALVYLLLTTGIKRARRWASTSSTSSWMPPTDRRSSSNMPARPTATRSGNCLLAEDWVPAYHEYLAQYAPTEKLFPWSPRRLEYLLEDVGNEAGLTKHLSFDMCRWTFALNDFRAGEEPDKIRQKLGVSKIQWRELYIKLKQLAGSRE